MRNETIIQLAAASLAAALVTTGGCNSVECGDGTIERDGACEPASETTTAGICGPFTVLVGDRCVPEFEPAVCDPTSTEPNVDPETGVVTCIGTGGGGGCNAPFACPTPSEANKLTICGQLWDLETNNKYQTTDAQGTQCDPQNLAASGPCALAIRAYDAVQFASNPSTVQPRPLESTYVDDCGRYRLVNIDINGTGPFIGVAVDDPAMPGPGGLTHPVGAATGKSSPVVSDFELFVARPATVAQWEASGGPAFSQGVGIYVAKYRAKKEPTGPDRFLPQSGVTFARVDGTQFPDDDFYFNPLQSTSTTISAAATATGANGTALVKGRSLAEGPMFSGVGGLGTGCRWDVKAAISIAGIVFTQVFRKLDLASTPGSCQD